MKFISTSSKKGIATTIGVTVLFLLFPIWVFVQVILGKQSFSSFGLEITIATFFGGIAFYFIFFMIKPPKAYTAKLIKKDLLSPYSYQPVRTKMVFYILKKKKQMTIPMPRTVVCESIGENNLLIGNDYSVIIKEHTRQLKSVKELRSKNDSSEISDKTTESLIDEANSEYYNTCVNVGFTLMAGFCGALVVLSMICMILYPAYILYYILFSVFFIPMIWVLVRLKEKFLNKGSNYSEKDSTFGSDLQLQKVRPFETGQKIARNYAIRDLLILLTAFPVMWIVLLLNAHAEKKLFFTAFLPILWPGSLAIIYVLSRIGYDKRLIRKQKINITESVNVAEIKNYKIMRVSKDIFYPLYFIVTPENNLILEIKKCGLFSRNFFICDCQDKIIGEIKQKIFSLTNKLTVNIVNEKPFLLYRKPRLASNYWISGRSYHVAGDIGFIRNTICDHKKREVAVISAISKYENNWYTIGSTKVVVNNNTDNSIDLMIIAFCITWGNFQTVHSSMNS